MKPNTIAFENKARAIVAKEFADFVGNDVVKVVCSSVYLPENDPGQWSPRSLLIAAHAKWQSVENALSKALGKRVFFEPINQAVSALHWA